MGTDYIRQIVSGKKARFVDHETSTNLDLVYITDRILIMGWPATGVASYYRNKRRDVLRFITARHGESWWIWNLCPLYENAYSPESMHNRVSRYPFPDHHPPPLPLLPLAAREMTAWLDGDPKRVAIIHCKAGKGRSGTLLCSYMLSLTELPPPPQLEASYSQSDLPTTDKREYEAVKVVNREGWVVVGSGNAVAEFPVVQEAGQGGQEPEQDDSPPTPGRSERIKLGGDSASSSLTTLSRQTSASSDLDVTVVPAYDPIDIGDEHEPGAVGQQDRVDGKVDAVFKLHSSRRMKPSSTGRGVSIPSQRRWVRYINLVFSQRAPPSYLRPNNSRIRLVSVTMYLTPPSRWQRPLAHMFVGSDAGRGKAWASVARYNDDYVAELRERGGNEQGNETTTTWGGVGGHGNHDSHKMFRTCGKLVAAEMPGEFDEQDRVVHHLTPQNADGSPIILDRSREFRLKFHLASLPLGWAWLIPAFHLREPTPPTIRTHVLRFPRSQIDFPLGPGQAIEEILVKIEEVPADDPESPARLLSDDEETDRGLNDDGQAMEGVVDATERRE